MKKQFLTLVIAHLVLLSFGQAKKKTVNRLYTVSSAIQRESLSYRIHVFGSEGGVSYEDVKDNFKKNSLLSTTSVLIKKNKILLNKYMDGVSSFGESQEEFFDINQDNFGFDFCSFNNQNVFKQGSIVYKYALNKLKLDVNERAATVVKDVLLPGLSNFEPLLASPDIAYFCLSSGYIARDFSNDDNSVLNNDAETVAIVISKSVLKKYINAEITDEQVFKLASFYNANKAISGVRKITIK